ncbi:cAMP-dependent protein kinase [Malassezia equina]|uniref:cAMP-dependent protein kinase n=1 Tax=Malassezia equina TaxID=1381935 RepID=A0AAF0J089_9BASI|nr:cAMP-dependent protein kinase [Malassezia equina]
MPNLFGFHTDKHEKAAHKSQENESSKETAPSIPGTAEVIHVPAPAAVAKGSAAPAPAMSALTQAQGVLSASDASHASTAPSQSVPASSPSAPPVASNQVNPLTGLPVRSLKGRYKLDDFSVLRTIGTGSFGRVHLVRSVHNQRFYAIKVLRKAHVVKMKQVEHANNEHQVLSMVRHPFLVNLWGTFQDPTFLYLVMDFVPGGELFTLLRHSRRFPAQVAKFYISEVALAIDFLHKHNIVYRDLKPENILIAADGHLKLIDFGFAKITTQSNGMCWTLCGTPDYLAPEIIRARGYNSSVDWWSVGVLLFEMLAGYPPFYTDDSNPIKLYEKILAGYVQYPSFFEVGAKDLLKSLLTADLSKRFGNLARGSRDIFSHMWFAEIDWDCLYRKEIPAPYVPQLGIQGDASQYVYKS